MQTLPPPGSTVCTYSRYSTALQSYSSIEGQQQLCIAYSERQGWIIIRHYADAERSGGTTYGRAGLFEMLAAAERGEFDILLVEDIDRTSRDAADMHQIAKQLEELDIVFCTVANGIVTDMELAFKAVQNQQFLKQNAQKAKRGQELVVKSGRLSGSIAYGHRKVLAFDSKGEPINGVREIDPEKASIVRRVHEDFNAGKTTFEICAALNIEGVPSPKGKEWRPGTLLGNKGGLGILRNPIYIGEFQFRKTQRKRRKGQVKTRFTEGAERIIVQHANLVIIDKDLWDRNQARLAASFDRPFHAKKKSQFAFTGKVFCGKCGSTCIVSDGKYICTGRSQKGICDNSRRTFRTAVEDSIFDRIKGHLLTDELIGPSLAAYRDEAERARAEHNAKSKVSGIRLKEISQRIDNLVGQLGATSAGAYSSKVLMQEIDQLGVEKGRLEQQLKLEPRPIDMSLDSSRIVERIKATLDDIQQALESDDREAVRARELVRGLIDRITLTPTEGTETDGRGAGDVTVTAEGALASLIDLAALNINRVIKHEHRPMFGLDNETLVWRFSYVLEWVDPRLSPIFADVAVASKLLDNAIVPITAEAFVRALAETEADDPARPASHRARNAIAYLQNHGFTRCINMKSASTGYVWKDSDLSDAAWKARVGNPPMAMPVPRIRVKAPRAIAIVVGPREPKDRDQA